MNMAKIRFSFLLASACVGALTLGACQLPYASGNAAELHLLFSTESARTIAPATWTPPVKYDLKLSAPSQTDISLLNQTPGTSGSLYHRLRL